MEQISKSYSMSHFHSSENRIKNNVVLSHTFCLSEGFFHLRENNTTTHPSFYLIFF